MLIFTIATALHIIYVIINIFSSYHSLSIANLITMDNSYMCIINGTYNITIQYKCNIFKR